EDALHTSAVGVVVQSPRTPVCGNAGLREQREILVNCTGGLHGRTRTAVDLQARRGGGVVVDVTGGGVDRARRDAVRRSVNGSRAGGVGVADRWWAPLTRHACRCAVVVGPVT